MKQRCLVGGTPPFPCGYWYELKNTVSVIRTTTIFVLSRLEATRLA